MKKFSVGLISFLLMSFAFAVEPIVQTKGSPAKQLRGGFNVLTVKTKNTHGVGICRDGRLIEVQPGSGAAATLMQALVMSGGLSGFNVTAIGRCNSISVLRAYVIIIDVPEA